MTFRSIYNEEQGGFGPLRVPQIVSQAFPNVRNTKYIKVLFIDKIKCATRLEVRSIAVGAIDCSPICVRS